MSYIETIRQRPIEGPGGFESLAIAAKKLHAEALEGCQIWDMIDYRLNLLDARLRKEFPGNYKTPA